MSQTIIHVALVVRDYDEAIDFYCHKLHFRLVEDAYQPEQDKRWVVVAPPGASESRLLLARAVGDEQSSRIGDQTGGRVFLFLYTDDFYDLEEGRVCFERACEFLAELKEMPSEELDRLTTRAARRLFGLQPGPGQDAGETRTIDVHTHLMVDASAEVAGVAAGVRRIDPTELDDAIHVDLDGIDFDIRPPPGFAAIHELENLITEYARVPADRRQGRDGAKIEVTVIGNREQLLDMLGADSRFDHCRDAVRMR